MDPRDQGARRNLGAAAEELAAAYLRLRGCEILARNVHIAGGEIDLVARRGHWLYLIEVRFRSTRGFGHPAETVQGRKARALARAARAYVSRFRGEATCWRLDVVTLFLSTEGRLEIRVIPGAVPLS